MKVVNQNKLSVSVAASLLFGSVAFAAGISLLVWVLYSWLWRSAPFSLPQLDTVATGVVLAMVGCVLLIQSLERLRYLRTGRIVLVAVFLSIAIMAMLAGVVGL
jgi:hypothetical protein